MAPMDRDQAVEGGSAATQSAGASADQRADRVILCLSGAGWRASLFHVGALIRWNELGLLSNLAEVHAVGGGSLVAGLLCVRWSSIVRTGIRGLVDLETSIARPLEQFVRRPISLRPSVRTRIRPRNWGKLLAGRFQETDRLVEVLEDRLLGRKLLGRLSPFQPEFRFLATNLRTGGRWEFTRARVGEALLGYRDPGSVSVAKAVVASMLCPARMPPLCLESVRAQFEGGRADFSIPSLRSKAYLCDGTLQDPLAIESALGNANCLLVSDGRCPVRPESGYDDSTAHRLLRSLQIQTDRAIDVRRRGLIQAIRAGQLDGAYISLAAHHRDFGLPDSTGYSHEVIEGMSRGAGTLPLSKWDLSLIVNHGYSIADAGARRLLSHRMTPAPFVLPHPDITGEPTILKFPSHKLRGGRKAA